ncbi:hypothetical protein ACFPL7_03215 [Dongia soli]|uniref:Serine protease n=1 Tax=Dongia soli TaxID=600628 RepID=A0ABU5EF27_9PROT|nr:hypothetical protein [Dongia soli]MDY0884700.1 hypothetical protein [Dongia soli]
MQRGRKYYVLSNAHVLSIAHGGARPAMGRKGDKVLYPGPADGGRLPDDWAAVLADIVPFKAGGTFLNRVDAALAEINRDRLDDLDFALYGVSGPPEMIAPQRGMTVIKRGRTTGDTEGVVQDINFRAVIDYDAVGPVGFLDQVLCTPHTKPGDSGSLVVAKESGKIVGLHFAGASGAASSIRSKLWSRRSMSNSSSRDGDTAKKSERQAWRRNRKRNRPAINMPKP